MHILGGLTSITVKVAAVHRQLQLWKSLSLIHLFVMFYDPGATETSNKANF